MMITSKILYALFIKTFFVHIDRQVILIDVLSALTAGAPQLQDAQLAINELLKLFNYGHNSIFERILKPKIEKVMFVATKIDQVIPDQHENIRALLGHLIYEACTNTQFEYVDISCEAIAAIRTTTLSEEANGTYLMGHTENYGFGKFFHPQIPKKIPTKDQWQQLQSWKLNRLLPSTNLSFSKGEPLPHIRLDSVIQELIGDRCR